MATGPALLLLGLALAAPSTPAPAPAKAQPAAAPTLAACSRYRVLAEPSELASDAEVAGWASVALEKAALLDKDSACWVQVRITAGPIRSGGRQDGWAAHVSTSTRRYLRDGKLVTNERGMLLVEATKGDLAAKAR